MFGTTAHLIRIPQPEFYYCTIVDIRDAGVPIPELVEGLGVIGVSDKRIQRLIRLVSGIMNSITSQFFQPWPKEAICNGSGIEILYTIEKDRMIEVESVYPVIASCPVSTDLYVVKDRFVTSRRTNRHAINGPYSYSDYGDAELLKRVLYDDHYQAFCFQKGNNNWVIKGAFGDIKILPKEETILTSPLIKGATVIFVEDATKFSEEDSIVISHQHFIINEILDGSSISIDPSFVNIPLDPLGKPIKVIRYGRIHDEIRDCAIRLVIDRLNGPLAFNNEDGTLRTTDDYHCEDIVSEKIDNWQWSKGKLSRTDRANNSLMANGTGNPYVDSVLRRYLPPMSFSFI